MQTFLNIMVDSIQFRYPLTILNTMLNKLHRLQYIILFSAFLLICLGTVRSTSSDPRGALLVSESLLTHQTLALDHYGPSVLNQYSGVIFPKAGHFYYYFPIGTSLASIPFIAAARYLGLDVLEVEGSLQIFIAACVGACTLFFLIKLAEYFLPSLSALLMACTFWFGSALVSTCGTALWSHNFAVLFALIAIYNIITKPMKTTTPMLLAFTLLFAYLCRPVLALLTPCALLFYWTYSRTKALQTAGFFAIGLLCFMGFSWHAFHQILPDYYLPQRLSGHTFLTALYGNLLSPARGLFIYSPFILIAWLCYPLSLKTLPLKKSWWFIGLLWPLLHLITVSRFPHWWAGYAFGPRFMTDCLPGLFLLTLQTWPIKRPQGIHILSISLLIFSILFSIEINSHRALFNHYTAYWNTGPNIDEHPKYLFDWKYPPFLHTRHRHQARLEWVKGKET